MAEKYDYDVIIIGAGISGLVCGCYLAKAGLKTLIVEKNSKVGGYCTSFERKGYYFDPCAHYLSSLRRDGLLRRILKELEIDENNIVEIAYKNIPIKIVYSTKIKYLITILPYFTLPTETMSLEEKKKYKQIYGSKNKTRSREKKRRCLQKLKKFKKTA